MPFIFCKRFLRFPKPTGNHGSLSFPQYGKLFRDFSTLWKKCFHGMEKMACFFHSMEDFLMILPCYGKTFILVCFRLFSWDLRLFSWAVERSTRRPLSTVERADRRGQEKRGPMQSGSALSRARCGCGVVARPFFWPRGRGSSRSQVRRGRCGWSEDLLRGLLKIPRGLRDHAAEGRRPDPSPERVRAVGTVPGAVQSPRLAGRPPLSKWPRVFRLAGHSGRVAGGLAAPSEAILRAK